MRSKLKTLIKRFAPRVVRFFLLRCLFFARSFKAAITMPANQLSHANGMLASLNFLGGVHLRKCPICGNMGYFAPSGISARTDAQCSHCGSLERHRLLYLCAIGSGILDDCDTLLHFAPEHALQNILRTKVKNYITADIDINGVDRKLNIENIDLESEQIDAIICNHVLEHVDDVKALGELFRILKPGGNLFCMVPIIEGWSATYENDSAQTDAQRTLHFGQNDHVRYYGRDFRDRVSAAGFSIEEFTAFGEDVVEFGLTRGEKVFVCHKQTDNLSSLN